MLKLHAVTTHHYKSFEPTARLELRPLTLLLGRNNAGKSSLLRLLPILARSASDRAASPLDLNIRDTRDNIPFTNAVWGHANSMTLELEWRDGQRAITDRFTISYNDSSKRTFIQALTITEDGVQRLHVEGAPNDDGTDYPLILPTHTDPLHFAGLRPDEDAPHEALVALRRRLRTLHNKIQWICAARRSPERVIQASEANNGLLAHDGGDAAARVCADTSMLDAVAPWYAGDELKRRLLVSPRGPEHYTLMLDRAGQDGAMIELLDTGEGMSQVLPVLVAAELARRAGPAAILAIEDPEDQLHENARAALAQHLARLASADDAPRMILETHSRTFLLGVQLAMARGLPPDRVAAYWIAQGEDGRSVASLVEFDRLGTPLNPIIAKQMEKDLDLSRQLLDLKLTASR
jgi:hypothetical protein